MLPRLYVVTGHIMCPVKLFYIIQHFGNVNNEQVGQFIVVPPHFLRIFSGAATACG